MKFILMDVDASSEILSSRSIIILVVAALIAIVAITAVFIWRKKKNRKQ
jgi:LPXTG-motif cell wall-anchored protein